MMKMTKEREALLLRIGERVVEHAKAAYHNLRWAEKFGPAALRAVTLETFADELGETVALARDAVLLCSIDVGEARCTCQVCAEMDANL